MKNPTSIPKTLPRWSDLSPQSTQFHSTLTQATGFKSGHSYYHCVATETAEGHRLLEFYVYGTNKMLTMLLDVRDSEDGLSHEVACLSAEWHLENFKVGPDMYRSMWRGIDKLLPQERVHWMWKNLW